MSSFFRFTVILVVAASLINLSIVIAGNHVGQVRQRQRVAAELQRMQHHYRLLTTPTESHLTDVRTYNLEPNAHIYVTSQELGADNKAISTTMLIRQYRINAEGKQAPMPTQKLVLPGDYYYFNAININFTGDLTDFTFLRGRTLSLFSSISTPAGVSLAQFFANQKIIDTVVPETVLESEHGRSQQEYQLWRMISDAFNAYLERHAPSGSATHDDDSPKGIEFTTPALDKRQMSRGRLYRLVVTAQAVILATEEDQQIVDQMEAEAGMQHAK